MQRKKSLTFELTTSALCDMNCTYCFEGVKANPERLEDLDVVIKRIQETLQSNFYKESYENISISFWGGEPTLNTKYIITMMNAFKDEPEVEFHMYSNGYNLDRMKEVLDNVDTSKLKIQISYDGGEINEVYRLTNKGLSTTKAVMDTFHYLAEQGIQCDLKSTLPLGAITKVYSAWKNFEDLHEKYKDYPNVTVYFAPTIDYTQRRDETIEDKVKLFRTEMLKIAKKEIQFYEKYGRHLMSWFNSSEEKVNCSAGLDMIAVDVDGKTYPCHGMLYADGKERMENASLYDDNFINSMEKFNNKFKDTIHVVPDICTDCVATYCAVCPAATFQISEKEDDMDKWNDRGVNGLCEFYQTFGEIDRTVQKYLRSKRKT